MVSIIAFILITATLLAFLAYGITDLIRSNSIIGILLFLFTYLAVYITYQVLLFDIFGNSIILDLNKALKELSALGVLTLWALSRRNPIDIRLKWFRTDYLILAFTIVPFFFVFLPIGPSSLVNKIIYFKGILMIGVMYFLGRVVVIKAYQVKLILSVILGIAMIAFFVTLIEYLTNTHFQSVIPFETFQREVNKADPSGNYGLTWTFEAASGAKRFAAFFANPLDMASAMLLCGTIALYLWYNESGKVYRLIYGIVFLFTVGTLLISFSRASFAGLALLLFFAAFLLGYWRIIVATMLFGVVFFVFIFTFGQEDLQYFIIDTLNFTESSSLSHIVEWSEAIDSIIRRPFGIGLATSGNAGGVDPDIQVGGENQFLIFAVQMGVPYMFLYILILYSSIRAAMRSFQNTNLFYIKTLAFVVATFKFSFLLPLLTANAETYLFVGYVSWFFLGVIVNPQTAYEERSFG